MDFSPPESDGSGADFPLIEGAVRDRIVDFLGGRDLASATCAHLASCDSENPARLERWPVVELDRLLRGGGAIARSLYDSHSILVHLDIEYVNHDSPAEAFTNPWKAFRAQEPVVAKIEELLSGWGIRPLHLLTGQGHHFVWRFPRGSELERRLANLFPSAYKDGSEQVFANLALLMDYFAFRIKAESQSESALPVEITAIQVMPGALGQRELISIDISEYGDPLASRTIRIPFTRYLKPWSTGIARRLGLEDQIGPCICIPLHEIDVMQALKFRQDLRDVVDLAKRCCTLIPDEGEGTTRLLEDYLSSPARAFHQRFYETEPDSPELWPMTYARTPLHDLPGCVRQILQYPNDLLLKPAGMRLATRCLLGKGWHPRHIAGLFRSKFEDPSYGWMGCWDGYSPAFRADFYVRLFSGQIAVGLDQLGDFHCDGLRAQGFCWKGEPPCDLAPYRAALSPAVSSVGPFFIPPTDDAP
jgi:hypothetical protein